MERRHDRLAQAEISPTADANLSNLISNQIDIPRIDLKTEFAAWRRSNRILNRHLVMAEQLGGRALRSARWERGMVMLRGIHLEIAQRSHKF